MNRPLILASSSPRRKTLLTQAGFDFTIQVADIDESPLPQELPEDLVQRLSQEKAQAVGKHHSTAIILAADTIVYYEKQILGKPRNFPEAEATLLQLQGHYHWVYTGTTLLIPELSYHKTWLCKSKVFIKKLSIDNIRAYFALVYPLDKAGGYAVQEQGAMIIDNIDGLHSNVMGLPIEEVIKQLNQRPFTL